MKEVLLISVLGKKNAGKTTLIERLIPVLKKRGLKVGTIKHDAHDFEIDIPGKDSYRHQKAGSDISVISSKTKVGMTYKTEDELTPNDLINKFMSHMDIVICEGYKTQGFPKIIVLGEKDILKDFKFENIIAYVSDYKKDDDVPCFFTSDADGLAEFLIDLKA